MKPTHSKAKRSLRIAIVALVVLWADLFRTLSFHWSTNPQYAFAWMVPLLSLLLMWDSWITRPAADQPAPGPMLFGIAAICAIGLLPTRIAIEGTPDWRFAPWALGCEVAGLSLTAVYLAGGRSWLRHLAFPILFNLVAIPWPVKIEQPFIQMLTGWVTSLTVTGLNLCDISALRQGNLIALGAGVVGVEEACSGVRSFQATFMVALFLGQFWAFGLGTRLLLLGSGVALAFACNVVRAWLLAFVADKNGIPTIDQWHDPAGFTILGVSFLGLLALALFLRPKTRPKLAPADRIASSRFPGWLTAGLVAFSALAFAGTEIWYRTGDLSAATWWHFERPTDLNDYADVPISDPVRKNIGYDEGWNARWVEDDGLAWNVFFFRWAPGLTTSRIAARWHVPEACMPSAGYKMKGAPGRRRIKIGDIDLVFKVYRFEDAGVPIHVFFCVWEDRNVRGEDLVPIEEPNLRNRWEIIRQRKRNLGQQVLEVAITGIENDQAAAESFEKHLIPRIKPDPSFSLRLPDP